MYFRIDGNTSPYALFQRFVRMRLAFMLPQMFCPRIDHERLQKTIGGFRITENPPAVGAIATPYTRVFIHGLHELCFPLSNNLIFDCNQHGTLAKLSLNFFDDNWHAPVVPWAQIGRRIGKLCEEREQHTPDCSDPGVHQCCSNVGSLSDRSPKGASHREASLINENENREHSCPYPIRRQVLHQSVDQRNKSDPGRSANQQDW